MEALKAVSVSKKFGQEKVLSDFSLTLEKGSFEALMGPSGCGKSTFINLASGLIGIDEGEIFIGDERVSSMSDSQAARFRRRHIGIVFQDFNLLESKNAKENILLPLKLDGAKIDAQINSRLDRLVDALEIAEVLKKKPFELSGGQKQRVALARALLTQPDVVLADEPTGNLDVNAARDVCAVLKTLNALSSAAILLVTHDPFVASFAQKVNFLKNGAIVESFETKGDPTLISRKYLEVYG